MQTNREKIKAQLITALQHPEAEEGLYFSNFYNLHEEDERPTVEGNDLELLDALKELMEEGLVISSEREDQLVFSLKK